MSDAQHKCPQCGKIFKVKKALSQHRKDAHQKQVSKSVKTPAANVAKGVTVRNSNTTSLARERGRDRFGHIPDVSKVKDSKAIMSVVFTPHLLPRLKVLASAYQRYQVHRLVFHIIPQIPTSVSGGYVAAFIRDPDDALTSAQAANILTATAGSVTAKWWSDSKIVVPAVTDQFYTATTPGQERFSSPGSLAIAVDGQANQSGSLSIYVDYDISFHAPGLEAQKDSGTVRVLTNVLMVAGNDYLATASGKTGPEDMFTPTPKEGMIMKLPSVRGYSVNTSGNVDRTANYLYVKVDSATSVRPCSKTGGEYGEKSYHATTFLFEGEELSVVSLPENLNLGSEFLCQQQTSESSTALIEPSVERSMSPRRTPTIAGDSLKTLEIVLKELSTSLQAITSSSMDSPKALSPEQST